MFGHFQATLEDLGAQETQDAKAHQVKMAPLEKEDPESLVHLDLAVHPGTQDAPEEVGSVSDHPVLQVLYTYNKG